MKIHTKVVYQMTEHGLNLISDESFEHKGQVTGCKGGGGQECPQPDPTPPYVYEPQSRANAAMAGNAAVGPNQAPAGVAGLPGSSQPAQQMAPPGAAPPGGAAPATLCMHAQHHHAQDSSAQL